VPLSKPWHPILTPICWMYIYGLQIKLGFNKKKSKQRRKLTKVSAVIHNLQLQSFRKAVSFCVPKVALSNQKVISTYNKVLQVVFPSACAALLCSFSMSFTTCFGLHGHLQVCRILRTFIFICLKKHARKETAKITKENSTGTKHGWKTCRVWPLEKR
jgi:hypothetical protein